MDAATRAAGTRPELARSRFGQREAGQGGDLQVRTRERWVRTAAYPKSTYMRQEATPMSGCSSSYP